MRRVTILQSGLEKSFSPSNAVLLIGLIGRHQIWRVDEDDLYIQRKNYICTVMPFCIERRKSSFFDKGHNQRLCKRPSQESVLEVRCISRPLERGIKREGDDFKEGDYGLGVMAL